MSFNSSYIPPNSILENFFSHAVVSSARKQWKAKRQSTRAGGIKFLTPSFIPLNWVIKIARRLKRAFNILTGSWCLRERRGKTRGERFVISASLSCDSSCEKLWKSHKLCQERARRREEENFPLDDEEARKRKQKIARAANSFILLRGKARLLHLAGERRISHFNLP